MSRLLQDMMRPDFYPHPCDRIELFQTKSSWLLFAGQFVYKVKKPLEFPLSDAATEERRLRLCRNELLVNQRIAPDVYLRIRSIVEDGGTHLLAGDDVSTNIRDYAVVMRRLPEDRRLDRMVAEGSISEVEMRELARKLAAFHASAATAKSTVWGSSQAIFRLVTNVVAEAEKLAGDSITRELLEPVGAYMRRYVVARRQTLDNRLRDNRVCEGHGGLRCDLIFFEGHTPVILGCVEDTESIRYADVASDLASLLVDLDLITRSDLGELLLRAYEKETDDPQLWEVIRFYKCYRAVDQGRLKALESLQRNLPFGQRIIARDKARHLLLLAHGYATIE